MSELHPALAAFAAERSSAFTALVGIEFAAIERGLCTLRLPIDFTGPVGKISASRNSGNFFHPRLSVC